MMKSCKFLLIVCFMMGVTFISAQPANYVHITGDEKAEMAKKISTASTQLQSLTVDFTQEKTSKVFTDKVISKGTMVYKKTGQLRWSYTAPSVYSIIINSKGSFFKNAGGVTKNKVVGELGGLILKTISGSGLVSSSDFSVEYYKNRDIFVIMKPLNKRFKAMYSSIEVFLNPQSYLATKVQLNEVNGDVTVIKFSNHKKNITIPASEFDETK